MVRIHLQLLVAVLLLIVSIALSAPNSLNDGLEPSVSAKSIPANKIIEGYQNYSSLSTANVSAETPSREGPRTLIMYGLLRWLFGIIKAIIQPARNMYITMKPEIAAFRCLSDTREFQNFMGFSGSDFEGYVYETPRGADQREPLNDGLSDDRIPSEQGSSHDMFDSELQQKIYPGTQYNVGNYPYYDPSENDVTQDIIQHRTDEVLKRIPRFIDEFASLLKEGQAMSCIMPYMRERVTRWLDS